MVPLTLYNLLLYDQDKIKLLLRKFHLFSSLYDSRYRISRLADFKYVIVPAILYFIVLYDPQREKQRVKCIIDSISRARKMRQRRICLPQAKGDAYASSAVPSKRALWHVFTTKSLAIVAPTVPVSFKPRGNVSPFQLFCIAVRMERHERRESDVRSAARSLFPVYKCQG